MDGASKGSLPTGPQGLSWPWRFEKHYRCLYVEQAAIGMMKSSGFDPVRSPDWFELDQPTTDAIIASIDEYAKSITDWEGMNASAEYGAICREKPYGAYLYDTMFVPLDSWYEVAPGRWGSSGTSLEQRLAHELQCRERRKLRIPDGLSRLAASIAFDRKSLRITNFCAIFLRPLLPCQAAPLDD